MVLFRALEPAEQRVADFTKKYHPSLEAALDAKGRHRFPHHSNRVTVVVMVKASDGFVTFYLPLPQNPNGPSGFFLFDYSAYSLDTICQSLSIHRLKVASPNLGESWEKVDLMPKDIESPANFDLLKITDGAPWIHEDIRRLAASGKLKSLPGLTVGPVVEIEEGIRTAIKPGRLKIWSPTFEFPEIGVRRLYLWTHADFWWSPGELNPDEAVVQSHTYYDVLALEMVLSSGVLAPNIAQRDTPTQAATILESQCDELLALVESDGDKEEKLHQWLNSHHLFIDPYAVKVWSKLRVGNDFSDFVFRRSDGSYILVEIERANKRIFRQDNSEPTYEFNHARQQVLDWQRYVRDNIHTMRNEFGLSEIYEPGGMVIMGRSQDINSDEARIRWRDMKGSDSLSLFTYDEIIGRTRGLVVSLRSPGSA
jgi:hypothetical protein